ncbi:MAG TPA: carboxymuconolactone decarboxylase family protein [Novosphingobium sp.]|nr:carboxymuconolactone decarboxylase family protein [Novosphingobium sp.]
MAQPITGPYRFDVAARMAQTVAEGPRIEPLDDAEMTPEVREICDRVRAGAGAGPAAIVPEYMRTMARHPALFEAQMEIGAMLYNGLIPPRERELAILRIGWLAGAPYEWGEHVRISQRVGVTPEEVERATNGSDADGWSEHEAAILRGVEELLADFAISDRTWATLAKSWNEAQMLEFPSMVGQYVATAYIQNSVRSRLGEGNPGLTHR